MHRNDRALPQLMEKVAALLKLRLGTRDWTLVTKTVDDLPPDLVALVLTLPAITYLVRAAHTREHGRENATTIPGAVYVNVDTAQLPYMQPHGLDHIAGLVTEQLMRSARDHGALAGYGGNPEREGGNFA